MLTVVDECEPNYYLGFTNEFDILSIGTLAS